MLLQERFSSTASALVVFLFLARAAVAQAPTSYLISTIAGGAPPATAAQGISMMASVYVGGVATDSAGNLYFCSGSLNAVFTMDTNGVVTRVAGNGARGYSGDGGPAINAQLNTPNGVAVDAQGNVFVADYGNRRIRKMAPDGAISTVAGNGSAGSLGDGSLATSAQLNGPNGVTVDASGNLYIADTGSNRIRRVSKGVITTVAGNGTAGYAGDGGAATAAQMNTPYRVAVDRAGNLYIADYGNNLVRKVTPDGFITTVAGNGSVGHGGDGGLATSAQLDAPYGIAVDGAGNLYIVNHFGHRIRLVTANGRITTLAGNGTGGYSGDGGPASLAEMYEPEDVAVDVAGNLYVTDSHNGLIRKVSPTGMIGTVVGGSTGDGSPAVFAQLYSAFGLAKDASGNLYAADYADHRIRKIAPNGTISTVAGNGTQGYSGDGGPATAAQLYQPWDVAVDGAGNLYIADSGNNCIRKVSVSGIITTVAGGFRGYSGDGGPAFLAQMKSPYGVTVDAAGNVYVADSENSVVRKISPNGTITTVAGSGSAGFSGRRRSRDQLPTEHSFRRDGGCLRRTLHCGLRQ